MSKFNELKKNFLDLLQEYKENTEEGNFFNPESLKVIRENLILFFEEEEEKKEEEEYSNEFF